jgi:hypothetical protein
MRDWSQREHRREGKTAFWNEIMKPTYDGPDGLRQRCINNRQTARETFARFGEFYLAEAMPPNPQPDCVPIPTDVEFLMFPEDSGVRDKKVVLVLRPPGTKDGQDDAQVWMCTYFPY